MIFRLEIGAAALTFSSLLLVDCIIGLPTSLAWIEVELAVMVDVVHDRRASMASFASAVLHERDIHE